MTGQERKTIAMLVTAAVVAGLADDKYDLTPAYVVLIFGVALFFIDATATFVADYLSKEPTR